MGGQKFNFATCALLVSEKAVNFTVELSS
jgi:hypothetical protein